MIKTFGTIKVKHPEAADTDILILHFAEESVMFDARVELEAAGLEIVEYNNPIFSLFRKADDAVKAAKAFCRGPVKTHKVKNLMTGLEIEIADGTPLCCDPSSETYWSM